MVAGSQGFDVYRRRSSREVEVADQVNIAPSDERDALEDIDGFEIGRRQLLLVDAREKQGVVVDDGVGDQLGDSTRPAESYCVVAVVSTLVRFGALARDDHAMPL